MTRNSVKQWRCILLKETICRFAEYKVFTHLQTVPCMLSVGFQPFHSQMLIPQQLVLVGKLPSVMAVLSACTHSLPMPMVGL